MRATALTLALALAAGPAAAQSSQEDRLREALRKTTVDLRAAQDAQVTLQASLDQMQKERDTLRTQVTQLTAAEAARPAEPAPAPAVAAPPPPPAQDEQLKAAVAALKQQNAELSAGLRKWQAAYQQAAGVAQAKDAEGRQAIEQSKTAQSTLGVCETKNKKMFAVANDVLHLYRQQDFKSLLLTSYEPLLGFKKVELENIVQDNEDHIREQVYYKGEQPLKPTTAPSAPVPAR